MECDATRRETGAFDAFNAKHPATSTRICAAMLSALDTHKAWPAQVYEGDCAQSYSRPRVNFIASRSLCIPLFRFFLGKPDIYRVVSLPYPKRQVRLD